MFSDFLTSSPDLAKRIRRISLVCHEENSNTPPIFNGSVYDIRRQNSGRASGGEPADRMPLFALRQLVPLLKELYLRNVKPHIPDGTESPLNERLSLSKLQLTFSTLDRSRSNDPLRNTLMAFEKVDKLLIRCDRVVGRFISDGIMMLPPQLVAQFPTTSHVVPSTNPSNSSDPGAADLPDKRLQVRHLTLSFYDPRPLVLHKVLAQLVRIDGICALHLTGCSPWLYQDVIELLSPGLEQLCLRLQPTSLPSTYPVHIVLLQRLDTVFLGPISIQPWSLHSFPKLRSLTVTMPVTPHQRQVLHRQLHQLDQLFDPSAVSQERFPKLDSFVLEVELDGKRKDEDPAIQLEEVSEEVEARVDQILRRPKAWIGQATVEWYVGLGHTTGEKHKECFQSLLPALKRQEESPSTTWGNLYTAMTR